MDYYEDNSNLRTVRCTSLFQHSGGNITNLPQVKMKSVIEMLETHQRQKIRIYR